MSQNDVGQYLGLTIITCKDPVNKLWLRATQCPRAGTGAAFQEPLHVPLEGLLFWLSKGDFKVSLGTVDGVEAVMVLTLRYYIRTMPYTLYGIEAVLTLLISDIASPVLGS